MIVSKLSLQIFKNTKKCNFTVRIFISAYDMNPFVTLFLDPILFLSGSGLNSY